jgi:IclR family acetate operon transcriptional repressor
MRKRPSDSLNSVDNALLLLHLLRDQGLVTVSQAAAALGISVSSAHRILVTLVYRDFAAQDAQRRYLPGPALSLHPGAHAPVAALRERLMPVMRALSTELTETVTLSVRLDTRVRVIAAVEAPRMLRVADQEGTVLPARLASSGKAMLATLPDDEVIDLFTSAADNRLTPAEARRLIGELAGIRRSGFAVNHGEAEQGVSAIGVAVLDLTGVAVAGLAVAMPSARFETVNVEAVVSRVRAALSSLNGISSDPTDIGRETA